MTERERIANTINHWKSGLLDLTKRNRALNFKGDRVSQITVVDEQPSEIFQLLCVQNRSLKFLPTKNTQLKNGENVSETVPTLHLNDDEAEYTTDANDFAIELDLSAPDFTLYDAASAEDRHTDEFLQTDAAPNDLDRSLRRLEEKAREVIEEQGVNALFLVLGTLHYREGDDPKQFYRAPLLLVPVQLLRKSARAGFTLWHTEDEPLVNPSLNEYLHRNFGIELPELTDFGSSDGCDLQGFFATVSQIIAPQKGWTVKNEIFLALFSFQKFAMYKDLEKNIENLANHKIINKIITRNGETLLGLPDEIQEMRLDEGFAPKRRRRSSMRMRVRFALSAMLPIITIWFWKDRPERGNRRQSPT